ncbi:carbamoyltransferase HypF [Calditrichota bacterium]
MQNSEFISCQFEITGLVQGVGFRPFVYRLAKELGIKGRVSNNLQGVHIDAEGSNETLEAFQTRLQLEAPSIAQIREIISAPIHFKGYEDFIIIESESSGSQTVLILPDLATCPECIYEIFDPANRRYRYPFTNCTNCGPRYSIIDSLPYDRQNTTMRLFEMCPACLEEYHNPSDRRFHAQPNACPECGPWLELWDKDKKILEKRDKALKETVYALKQGKIIALKGLGGFQLLVDAGNEDAVALLRKRKRRDEKPIAMMYPNMALALNDCRISDFERQLLLSHRAPIVLLQRRSDCENQLADNISPGNPSLGIMLPYTPLHHLILSDFDAPLVATSGNLSDEPICIDENEAITRIGNIADLFLVHNRPIVRHVDDSVTRKMLGGETVLRRARGYAPLPILVNEKLPTLLAVGGHLKNTVALSRGNEVFISQHIGDLETDEAYSAFKHVARDLPGLLDAVPKSMICDSHPDYLSTIFAYENSKHPVKIQHHIAHALSCAAENKVEPPFHAISWDGTGWGDDGTIWGGESFRVDDNGIERFGHLRTFPLPGGDTAVKQPWRSAVGILFELFGEKINEYLYLLPRHTVSVQELSIVETMLKNDVNCIKTSSMGRLFDAVASIAGLRQKVSFEGQAAMELEFSIDGFETDSAYSIQLVEHTDSNNRKITILDWEPFILELLQDLKTNKALKLISAKFHNSLVNAAVSLAQESGMQKIVLSGGCFQNVYLTTKMVNRLREGGFHVFWHHQVPPNDGGISFGQIMAAKYFWNNNVPRSTG